MIICVLIPEFAAMIERQHNPALANIPLIIGGFPWQQCQVYAASAEAKRAGVQPGMSISQAWTLCPQGRFLPPTESRYQRAFEQLLTCLCHFTDRLERHDTLQTSAVCYLDIGNVPEAELEAIGKQVFQVVQQATGLCPKVGIASGKFPAQLVAASVPAGEAGIILPGQEAAFVSPFSVSVLPLDKPLTRHLQLLGIRTLGDLAQLPRKTIRSQFGKASLMYYQLAHGIDERPMQLYQPAQQDYRHHAFAVPVDDWQIVETVIKTLAKELAGRLNALGNTACKLEVCAALEDRTHLEEVLLLKHPVADAPAIAHKCLSLLKRMPISCGITGLEITLSEQVANIPVQLALFPEIAPEEQQLETVLHNLASHHDCFYRVRLTGEPTLLLERQFQLRRIEAA